MDHRVTVSGFLDRSQVISIILVIVISLQNVAQIKLETAILQVMHFFDDGRKYFIHIF